MQLSHQFMLQEEFIEINNNYKTDSITKCQETQKSVKTTTNFGYNESRDIMKDLNNEIIELQNEIDLNNNKRIEEELGDVIFVLCNLANQYNINLNDALNHSTEEYQRRLTYVENKLQKTPTDTEIIQHWKEAKNSHKK